MTDERGGAIIKIAQVIALPSAVLELQSLLIDVYTSLPVRISYRTRSSESHLSHKVYVIGQRRWPHLRSDRIRTIQY